MVICYACGTNVPDETKFCPLCGKPINEPGQDVPETPTLSLSAEPEENDAVAPALIIDQEQAPVNDYQPEAAYVASVSPDPVTPTVPEAPLVFEATPEPAAPPAPVTPPAPIPPPAPVAPPVPVASPPVYAPPAPEKQAEFTPPPVQNPPYSAAPVKIPKGAPFGVVGTGGFIGLIILFAIPVIGWISCIVMAFAAKNLNRRNYARAILVLAIIGIIAALVTYIVFAAVFTSIWESVSESVVYFN